MKKIYQKPLIIVEHMFLDDAIANSTCVRNYNTDPDVPYLEALGCFVEKPSCTYSILPGGGIDFNGDGKSDTHDTVCYHSNIETLFLS